MKEGINNVAPEVQTWTCPTCGKIIHSIYPGQFIFLQKQHNLTHDKQTNSDKETKEAKP